MSDAIAQQEKLSMEARLAKLKKNFEELGPALLPFLEIAFCDGMTYAVQRLHERLHEADRTVAKGHDADKPIQS